MSSTLLEPPGVTSKVEKEEQQRSEQQSTPTTTTEPPPHLRKLTLWTKINLALLHTFCAALYVLFAPFGHDGAPPPAIGAAFISAMFGFMMFIPAITCYLIVTFVDAAILPGAYAYVMDKTWMWCPALVIWYLYTVMTDTAPNDVTGANHRPPRNAVNRMAHKLYYWSVFEYFPITVVPWKQDATLPPSRQYIFVIHPHGIFCWSLYMFAAKNTPFDQRFPGLCGEKLTGLIASVLFKIPVLRDFFLEWPYVDASRKTANAVLDAGRSIYVIPGGEEESVLTRQGEDIVVLSKRKGFIRLALSHGADIVPVFGAGTTDSFTTYPNVLSGARHWLQKTCKVALAIWHGRYYVTPLPQKVPVKVLIGEPIRTPMPAVKGEKPDEALVEEFHKKYVTALKELHDQHVKDRPLIIR